MRAGVAADQKSRASGIQHPADRKFLTGCYAFFRCQKRMVNRLAHHSNPIHNDTSHYAENEPAVK
jgi:hypothetical protein